MDQTTALNILKSGKNVFLTGEAGSGKTYVLNNYIRYLRACGINVAITASTGIAATHIGGTTIHSWSGIGIKEYLTDYDIDMLTQKEYLHKNINSVSVLIIDEISMLSANTLDMIDRIVREIRNDQRPFGGMQVIFCGDFFQLPPVQKYGSSDTKRFAFASKAWKESDLFFCYLDTQHRQKDEHFGNILNQLRTGNPSEETIDKLKQRVNANVNKKSTVKLYTHNIDVDRINFDELFALDGEESIFMMKGTGDKKYLESLKKSTIAQELLRLKVGAKVIFIKNNPAKKYRNGTTGIVISFDKSDGLPNVKVDEDTIIKVEPELRMIEDADEILASVKQIPLKLAWAITIHKSQGMSLDSAEIDLSKSFESGQAYVALSRVRSLDGLTLLGLNVAGLSAHPLVVRADNYFKQQSYNIYTEFQRLSKDILDEHHKIFVEKSGGKYDLDKITKPIEKKQKLSKKDKPDTILQTVDLIEQGKNFNEIAQIRGLTDKTILEHLAKIKSLHPKVKIKQFKPDSKIFNKVVKAFKQAKENKNNINEFGQVRLRSVYDLLDGEIGYDDIKLSMLFME